MNARSAKVSFLNVQNEREIEWEAHRTIEMQTMGIVFVRMLFFYLETIFLIKHSVDFSDDNAKNILGNGVFVAGANSLRQQKLWQSRH